MNGVQRYSHGAKHKHRSHRWKGPCAHMSSAVNKFTREAPL